MARELLLLLQKGRELFGRQFEVALERGFGETTSLGIIMRGGKINPPLCYMLASLTMRVLEVMA